MFKKELTYMTDRYLHYLSNIVNNIHSHQNIYTTIARGIICVKGGETVRFQADKENGEDQHTQALKCCICHNIDCIID